MDEILALFGAAEESTSRVKRLVMYLLNSQRQLEQDIESLKMQQKRLCDELRSIRKKLQIHPTDSEVATSSIQPQQQELTHVQQQQHDTKSNQSLHSLKFIEDMLPPSKKQKATFDNNQQCIEATITEPVQEKAVTAEEVYTSSQKQTLQREKRAKRFSQRHQEARKGAQRQAYERLKRREQENKQKDERKS
ncbi:hypothetical protein MAM1_0068d04067 [Mucor ambiguus]|uniref:Uncharacterized protein n=1 Tax=Mucor ambiguus TaxID=91626 RepID=A0A0C9M547_9FUNG|nr:hypothetical protein MAM1_0068d04067 [Mucor ambiguus]